MPPTKWINASQAHKLLIRQGYDISYPTAIKWLRDNGLSSQSMRYGTIQVDEARLIKFMRDRKIRVKPSARDQTRKAPGRKKSDD